MARTARNGLVAFNVAVVSLYLLSGDFPGEKMVGEFKNDKPWIVSIFDNDGEIVKRISYGMEYK